MINAGLDAQVSGLVFLKQGGGVKAMKGRGRKRPFHGGLVFKNHKSQITKRRAGVLLIVQMLASPHPSPFSPLGGSAKGEKSVLVPPQSPVGGRLRGL